MLWQNDAGGELRGRGAVIAPRGRRGAVMALAVAALMLPAFAPASGEPARKSATLTSPPAEKSQCNRATFRVVVDVGHSAEAPGALSARGVPEYEFNLSLARWIEQSLVAAGFDKTVRLISSGLARESLRTRIARANRLSADLFLSIHHDSVPDRFLQDWEHDGNQLHYSDRFKGHSIFVSNAHRDYRDSLAFGRLLGRQLKASGLVYTPHYTRAEMGSRRRQLVDAEAGVYRYDRLMVLRQTRMPAVLFEAASIINRDEELKAMAPERKALVAAAVTRAVVQFCDAREAKRTVRGKRARPMRAAKPRIESATSARRESKR
jgi:N-acetylmuramoyl-L-alanine amidase